MTIEGNGDCKWIVRGDLETDEPGVADTTTYCEVELVSNGSGNPMKLECFWEQSTFYGVELPTEMEGSYSDECEDSFGLSYGGVTPSDPDGSGGGDWDNVEASTTSCESP